MARLRPFSVTIIHASLLGLLACGSASASWQANGNLVHAAWGNQSVIVPDGAGGAIVAWLDSVSASNRDIYAQRVDSLGLPLWPAGGVAVCTTAADQQTPALLPDGAGGAFFVWDEAETTGQTDIYAQRLDAFGNMLWTPGGIGVCTVETSHQVHSRVVSDGGGGFVIAWQDYRGAGGWDVYAQRLGANGNSSWGTNGKAICTGTADESEPELVPDGAGGAILAWRDSRAGNWDIYAQRVDPLGNPLWAAGGVPLCTVTSNEWDVRIASDGAQGAIATWEDLRAGNYDIYAQRVDSLGAAVWSFDGVAVSTGAGMDIFPRVLPDGSGGAIIAWTDNVGMAADVYAQRVSAAGSRLWLPNGAAVCVAMGPQAYPEMVPDGAGGAILAWQDYRAGDWDIYAQRVNAAGTALWPDSGVVVAALGAEQSRAQIASNGSGGALVSWRDYRTRNWDAYVQRLVATGNPSAPGYTDVGSGVSVEPVDPATGQAPVAVTFDSVSTAGMTSLQMSSTAPPNPGFKLGNPETYYEVSTTAGYTGAVTICIHYAGVSYSRENGLKLFHYEDGHWKDCTTSLDTDADIICGTVTSFSFFGIFEESSADVPPPPGAGLNVLRQNSPNPFTPATSISFSVARRGPVRLVVRDMAGRTVRVLLDGVKDAGTHRVRWNGRDESGREVASGVYVCVLEAPGYSGTRRMVVVR